MPVRDEIAKLVLPVFVEGLDLREKLARGNVTADFRSAQDSLRKRLTPSRSPGDDEFFEETTKRGISRQSEDISWVLSNTFLGIRYALACWLDEIFTIEENPWKEEWNKNKVEVALFHAIVPRGERAWVFWEQAALAERKTDDAMEVFYLCVMLGFQGRLREQPAKLKEWIDRIRARLVKAQASPPLPTELDLVPYHPPLRGRDRFATMFGIGGCVVFVAIILLMIAFR